MGWGLGRRREGIESGHSPGNRYWGRRERKIQKDTSETVIEGQAAFKRSPRNNLGEKLKQVE